MHAGAASQYCCLLRSPGLPFYRSEFDNDSISSGQFGCIQGFGYTENRQRSEKKSNDRVRVDCVLCNFRMVRWLVSRVQQFI